MKALLARAQAPLLASLAATPTLLAFDFDGTLAPLVDDRRRAQLRPRTRTLLTSLAAQYPVAVISGRGRADLEPRLGGARVQFVIGNHGAEWSARPAPRPRALARALKALEAVARAHPGLEVEDKGQTLAVHSRHAAGRARAEAAVRQALRPLGPTLRLVPGKCVVNVLPRQAPHKGDALREAIRQSGAQRALFVGDDDTDEDAFRAARALRLVAVRVGRKQASAAAYFLERQERVDELLARLLALRA